MLGEYYQNLLLVSKLKFLRRLILHKIVLVFHLRHLLM
jgi:hypothetical protein